MKYYEGMFLTHNKEARKDTDYLAEHVTGLIEKSGGTVAQITKWDERKLAYPIKGVTHGVYFLTYFSGDAATDARLRGEIRLSSLVLRHLTLGLGAPPEGPIETFSDMQTRLAGGDHRETESEGGPVAEKAVARPATPDDDEGDSDDTSAPDADADADTDADDGEDQ